MKQNQKLFLEMTETHKDLFAKFKDIHDLFVQDHDKYKKEFNEVGSQVVDVVRRYENILCGKTENSQYGKFSNKLSEKFWQAVRTIYPKIDFVGIK
jgi:hypothetical protein